VDHLKTASLGDWAEMTCQRQTLAYSKKCKLQVLKVGMGRNLQNDLENYYGQNDKMNTVVFQNLFRIILRAEGF